jgi:Chaperone of endosialidase
MANTDKNIVITPNIGSSTANPNIVFTGGNTSVANSINMTMYASGTLSWDGTAGQLFSITNSLTGTIFSINDVSGIPSMTVNSLGNIVLAQYGGNVTIGSALGQTSNLLSVTGNVYVSGNSYVAQNHFVSGNVAAYGSNNLFGSKVGIGTSSSVGANSNVLAVYGTSQYYGNIVIQNQAAGGSGIYFADGSFQITANPNPYSNANIASYLSGPVQIGNLTIVNTTVSTSTTTGALLMGGGAGIGGNINVGGQTNLFSGNITINGTNASTSTATGALVVATGGVGIGGNLVVGGTAQVGFLNVGNSVVAASIVSNTSIQVASTATVNTLASNVYGLFGQNVTINSTNLSVTLGTGALVLLGGAGIGGNINVGGSRSIFQGFVGIGTSSNAGVNSNTMTLYGTSMHYGNIVLQNTTAGGAGIYFADGTFQITANSNTYSNVNVASYLSGPVQIGNLTIVNTTISSSTTTGALLMGGGAGIAGNINVGGQTNLFSGNIVIGGSNAATSASTGALIITSGGIGVGGNLVAGGTAQVGFLNAGNSVVAASILSNTTIQVASTATVNTLISNIYGVFGQNVTVNSTNAATSATTGALVVAGGVGITGNLVTAGTAQVGFLNAGNSVVAASIVSNTTLQAAGTVTAAAVNSNGTILGNNIYSNGFVQGGAFTAASVNSNGTIVGNNIYSNGFVQAFGTLTVGSINSNGAAVVNSLKSNTAITVSSGGITVSGISQFNGNVNVAGNLNVTGTIVSTNANVLVIQSPLIYLAEDNPADTYDLGIVGAYTLGNYYHTGVVRNHLNNVWTVFDTLTTEPNVITGNINWSDSSITYGAFAAGNVVIYGNTRSTSSSSGALILNGLGGIGVGGNVYVNGQLSSFAGNLVISGSNISTGTNSGAMVVTGGVGIGGNINVGGQQNTILGNLLINGTNATTSTSTGALVITTGGAGIGGNLVIGGTAQVGFLNAGNSVVAASMLSNTTIQATGTVTANTLISNVYGLFGQNVTINSTNAATSATTGALVVAGGVGIAGNLVTASTAQVGFLNVGNSVVAGSILSNTTIQVASTATVNTLISNVYGLFGQNVTINSTNAASAVSATTGALVVAGGAGIASGLTTTGLVNFIGSGALEYTVRIKGSSTGDQFAIATNGTAGYGVANDALNAAGTAYSPYAVSASNVTIKTGATSPAAALTITTFGNGIFAQNLTISSSNASTSSTTGALIVGGGVGVGGNLRVAAATTSLFGGNVGIGTTSSLGATANVMSVYGTAMHYGNIVLQTTTSGGTGIYFPDGTFQTTASSSASNTKSIGTTGTVQFAGAGNAFAGDSSNFFWDNTNKRLGIGTGTPAATLSVYGNTQALFNTATGAGSKQEIWVGNGTVIGAVLGYDPTLATSAGFLRRGDNSSPAITFTSTNVGINGVTAPQNALDVSGSVVIGFGYAGSFTTGRPNSLAVQNSVGIGTASMNSNLDVWGTMSATLAFSTGGTATVNTLISNVYGVFGQNVTINSTNVSIGTNSGALVVGGGAGIGGNLNVGGNIVTTGTYGNISGVYNLFTGNIFATGGQQITGSNISSSTSTGALVLTQGGLGVNGNIYAGGNIVAASTGATVTQFWASANDSAAQPGYSFSGDINTGMFQAATTTLGFATGGAERMRIDANGNLGVQTTGTVTGFVSGAAMNTITGRIGIGTSSNSFVLNSNVFSVFGTAMYYGNIVMQNVTAGGTGIYFPDGTYQTTAYSTATSGVTSIAFGTTGLTPTAATAGAVSVAFGSVATAAGIYSPASNQIALSTASTARLLINANGNLLINTTTAPAGGNATVVIQGVGTNGGGMQLAGGTGGGGNIYGINGGGLVISSYSGAVGSEISKERLRIDANGNVGIGTSTVTSGFIVQMQGNVKITGAVDSDVQFLGQPADTASTPSYSWTGDQTTGMYRPNTSIVGFTTAGTERLRIDSVGNVGIPNSVSIGGYALLGAANVNTFISTNSLNVGSGGAVVNALSSNVYGLFGQNVTVNSTNAATSATTGALTVAGGVGIAGNLITGGTAQVGFLNVGNSVVAGSILSNTTIQVASTATVNTLVSNVYGLFGQNVTINSSNAAISATTGAFVVAGGIGVSGAVIHGSYSNFAQNITVLSANVSTSSSTGAVVIGTAGSNFGGLGVAGNINSGGQTNLFAGNIIISGSNAATSASTGALIITSGGIGVGGNLVTGGTAQVGFLNVGNSAVAASIVSNTTVQAAGTATANSIIGNIYGLFGQNVTVNSTNAATSATTGALTVAGGVGVGGNLRVAAATTSLFGGNVGIGTTSSLGATANVMSVYGTAVHYGNIVMQNVTAGGTGIYFPDGTFQTTAYGTATSGVTSIAFGTTGLTPTAATAGAVSVAFGSVATAAGIYSPASNQIALSTASTARLLINANGNLLVNTTTAPAGGSATLVLNGVGTNQSGVMFSNVNIGGGGANISGGFGNSLVFSTIAGPLGSETYTERMRLYGPTGNLLIGTAVAPAGGNATVVIAGLGTNGGGIELSGGAGGGGNIYAINGGGLVFGTYTGAVGSETYAERMRLTTNGNLLVNGSTAPAGGNAQVLINNLGTNAGGIQLAGGTGGGGNVYGINGGGLVFGSYTGAVGSETYAERMRIDANGNIATTGTTATTGYNIDLKGAIRIASTSVAGAQISFNNATSNWIAWTGSGLAAPTFTTSSAGTKLILYPNVSVSYTDFAIGVSANTLWNSITAATVNNQFAWYGGTTQVGTLTGTGNLSVIGEVTAYSSDERLKDNVVVIGDALDKLQSIRGVTFNWNMHKTNSLGFMPHAGRDVGVIAQEIQAVLPEAVRPAPFDWDSVTQASTTGDNYLTVQYEKLTALLIEAVKELKQEVDDLRARLPN